MFCQSEVQGDQSLQRVSLRRADQTTDVRTWMKGGVTTTVAWNT